MVFLSVKQDICCRCCYAIGYKEQRVEWWSLLLDVDATLPSFILSCCRWILDPRPSCFAAILVWCLLLRSTCFTSCVAFKLCGEQNRFLCEKAKVIGWIKIPTLQNHWVRVVFMLLWLILLHMNLNWNCIEIWEIKWPVFTTRWIGTGLLILWSKCICIASHMVCSFASIIICILFAFSPEYMEQKRFLTVSFLQLMWYSAILIKCCFFSAVSTKCAHFGQIKRATQTC